jgi:hypothetical protein
VSSQTSNFTATIYTYYYVTASTITVTAPSSPSTGAYFVINNYNLSTFLAITFTGSTTPIPNPYYLPPGNSATYVWTGSVWVIF